MSPHRPLEPTNRPYALAKIAGIEMCWSYNRQHGTKYLTAMRTNLYGPGDNFDFINSTSSLPSSARPPKPRQQGDPNWSCGAPPRASLLPKTSTRPASFSLTSTNAPSTLFTETDPAIINIGTREDVTIRELAETVSRVLGFHGALTFDHTKPDGTLRKLMDVTRLHTLGWHHTTSLDQGIRRISDLVKPQFMA